MMNTALKFECPSSPEYAPRDAVGQPLYVAVSDGLETFLARQEQKGRPVPRFVEREFRNFLECGIYAGGFLRVHCDDCGCDRVVPFSCKGRGVCPSCGGRRMADTAAHLTDRVFPHVSIRQWVLSLPYTLRFRLGYDSRMVAGIHHILINTIFSYLRRATGLSYLGRTAGCGAVTFVQRFGDALNLNVHFHVLALDGVYARSFTGKPIFYFAPPVSQADIEHLTGLLAGRIGKYVSKLQPMDFDEDSSFFAPNYAESIIGKKHPAPRSASEDWEWHPSPLCSSVDGVNLQAATRIPAGNRPRLEQLCRYTARSAISSERLEPLPDGNLRYHFKKAWHNGDDQILFSPQELIARLAALVPPPRFNLVRYSGVFAPCSKWRELIVPVSPAAATNLSEPEAKLEQPVPPSAADPTRHERRYTWAELLKRVFAVDVLECPRCHGRMRILCAIHPPTAIWGILTCLGLPVRAPPLTPARFDEEFQIQPVKFNKELQTIPVRFDEAFPYNRVEFDNEFQTGPAGFDDQFQPDLVNFDEAFQAGPAEFEDQFDAGPVDFDQEFQAEPLKFDDEFPVAPVDFKDQFQDAEEFWDW